MIVKSIHSSLRLESKNTLGRYEFEKDCKLVATVLVFLHFPATRQLSIKNYRMRIIFKKAIIKFIINSNNI